MKQTTEKSPLWLKKKGEKRRDEPNEPFELHGQGKGTFPPGVYRVRCGGWVGLAGVRESKVCSES